MENNDKGLQAQKAIEQKWHTILVDTPDPQYLRTAYEELHLFYLCQKGFLYRRSLNFHDKVVLAVVGKGKKVLELGSGSGILACALGKQGNKVLGLDVSSIAVEEGRKLAARWGVAGRVQFIQGDAVHTGFAEASFDIVVSTSLIEHVHPSEIGYHFREVRRVLRPKGVYLLFTPNKYDGPSSLGMHLREWGFTEMRRLLEGHGFRSYWVETRSARLGKPRLIPPKMLWIPDMLERVYVGLGCKRWLRPVVRPSVYFYAKKVST